MTSTIVPPVDLAPGMPSRVVTISATDVTEGGQSLEGQMVRFALSDTLDVSSGGDVIAKTQAEVVLDSNGEGRIRLPVYDDAVKTWCGKDWAILVTATWGSQKAIRVPAGTSSIALSALPSVRPLRGREKQWAVTGASVSVTEGAAWDVDVSLSGGVLGFDFTVPPGATAWWKGATPLSVDDSVFSLDSGSYSVWSDTVATSVGLPTATQGIVEVFRYGTSGGFIRWTARALPSTRTTYTETWQTVLWSTTGWADWERIDAGASDKWNQNDSALQAGTVLDDLPSGTYSIWSAAVSDALAMPETAQWSIDVKRWGAAGGIMLAQTRTDPPRSYMSARLSGGWTGWTRSDSAGVKFRLPEASPASLKSTPLALTTGYGSATRSGSGTTSVIQYLPEQATRYRLHIRNWSPRYATEDAAPVALTTVRIRRHTGDGNGTNSVVLPDGSTGYASGWVDIPDAQRGAEVVVQYTWTGSDVRQCLGTGWTDGASDQRPPLFVWLELEVPASVPVVADYGSSTAVGVGSDRPLIDSWLSRWARANGAIPAFWADSGSSALTWMEGADRRWERYGYTINAPDAMLYAMGSNDWAGGFDLAELQRRITATVQEIRDRITPNVYGTTITPRATPPADDSTRIALNAWMPGSGLFRDVFDAAAAVSLPDGSFDPAADADGIHPNDVGHQRIADAIDRSVISQGGGAAVTYLGDGVYEIG